MLDQIFLSVNSWMNGGFFLAALGCFIWGMISVLFSPCHLASIPLIIGYVGGQNKTLQGRQAVQFALLFTGGLFLTISIVGVICSLLGRMLGDVGPYWTLLLGALLLWVAFDMLGVAACSLPRTNFGKLKLQGKLGAFLLGLVYGVLSGTCTFGFIAPILAIITVQKKIITGIILITLFALGHCLPIAIAGSSTATVKRFLENSSMQQSVPWFRKGAGLLIGSLGIYFLSYPFL